MDLKIRIEVLPCGMCEEMMGCDTCLYSKEAHDLYYQIRAEAIDEMVNSLGTEPFSAYVMEIIRHWAKKLKEQNRS